MRQAWLRYGFYCKRLLSQCRVIKTALRPLLRVNQPFEVTPAVEAQIPEVEVDGRP